MVNVGDIVFYGLNRLYNLDPQVVMPKYKENNQGVIGLAPPGPGQVLFGLRAGRGRCRALMFWSCNSLFRYERNFVACLVPCEQREQSSCVFLGPGLHR